MSKILITGGARSGKSRLAQTIAEGLGTERVYLATAEVRDEEMARRVRRHQADRGSGWSTLEVPIDIAGELDRDEVVLVDCLTFWLTNVLLAELDAEAERDRLVGALRCARGGIVLVTNEVGSGIVPVNELARRFRDEAGWLAQAVAEVCDEVHLCAAGLPLRLK